MVMAANDEYLGQEEGVFTIMHKQIALVLMFALLLAGTPASAQQADFRAVDRDLSSLTRANLDVQISRRVDPRQSMLRQAIAAAMQRERNAAPTIFQSPATASYPVRWMLSRGGTAVRPVDALNRSVLTTNNAPHMTQRRRTRPQNTATSCSVAIVERAETDAEERGVGAYIGGGFLLPVIMPLIADSVSPERPPNRLMQGIEQADATCYSDYYGERVKSRKVGASWTGTWIGIGLYAGLMVLAYTPGR